MKIKSICEQCGKKFIKVVNGNTPDALEYQDVCSNCYEEYIEDYDEEF